MINVEFFKGAVVQQARAVHSIYASAIRAQHEGDDNLYQTLVGPMLDKQCRELGRLLDNTIQMRSDWGDTIQLAGLIILLVDGYRTSALDLELKMS